MARGKNKQPSQRQLRVAEEIKHTLSKIIQRGELNDPELSGLSVTVTQVQISADLRLATVFILPLGGDGAEGVVNAMARATPYLRRRVSKEVALKFVPTIRFLPDETFEYADRISKVLQTALHSSPSENNTG